MQWFINDLSLDGQFADSLAFRGAIEPLLRLRAANRAVREGLFCSRRLSMRRVTPVADFTTTIRGLRDPNLTNLVLAWLTKQGPFWDDDRQPNEEDYFEHQGMDVTDQGLGEAARRRLSSVDSGVFSFLGSPLPFDRSPLEVQQGLPEEPPLASVEVDNFWLADTLKTAAEAFKGEPGSWEAVLTRAEERFPGLVLSGEIADFLAPYPFSSCVVRRVFELLGVLERIVVETDEAGALSQEGQRLYGNHFFGDKGWFSDESATNRSAFKQEMTFPNPSRTGEKLFCPWHGKIKTPQFRIHFEWPRPEGQREIKVVYIGPKITKK